MSNRSMVPFDVDPLLIYDSQIPHVLFVEKVLLLCGLDSCILEVIIVFVLQQKKPI